MNTSNICDRVCLPLIGLCSDKRRCISLRLKHWKEMVFQDCDADDFNISLKLFYIELISAFQNAANQNTMILSICIQLKSIFWAVRNFVINSCFMIF